ncbi:MAG: FG-GAP repeat protein, partial [Anaerolineaceae bacterium]|nr:FG-GAP repeat protein [Anaerolineaceae bacterium]
MKSNFLRIFASLAILSLLLPSSSIQARQSTESTKASVQDVESDVDPTLPEGLTSSEWQSIQNQVMSNLSQQAYLKASNTGREDNFGLSVAVSNDTLVVGAINEDSAATGVDGDQNDNSAPGSGAAYVFVRNGTTWTQQAYLKASNTDANDQFGCSVAVSNDTLVVGAWLESSAATGINGDQNDESKRESGAAYVFVRSGATWTQQAYLKASNTDVADWFGYSVAVSNDTVVVGADSEASAATGVNGNQNDNSASYAGAAYVFVRSGTTWTQQAYLKASNTFEYDEFGTSVAVSNDTIVVGADGEASAATGVDGDQNDNSAP